MTFCPLLLFSQNERLNFNSGGYADDALVCFKVRKFQEQMRKVLDELITSEFARIVV